MKNIFFDSWVVLGRTAVIGVLAYFTLIAFLRLSGNRTLSKMHAFDLVVTVALGSTLASIVVDRSVALAQGALAFALLIGLQFSITWSSVRSHWVRKLVTGEPTLLLFRGTILKEALQKARFTEEEIYAAVRGAGLSALNEANAVVLETDGSISVVRGDPEAGVSTLDFIPAGARVAPDSRQPNQQP